jgi:hypothetical protein
MGFYKHVFVSLLILEGFRTKIKSEMQCGKVEPGHIASHSSGKLIRMELPSMRTT